MDVKKILIALLLLLPLNASAFMTDPNFPAFTPNYYIDAFIGYGSIDGANGSDGQYAQGRLALALDVYQWQICSAGLELGLQSGKTLRLDVDENMVETTGGLNWQATLNPFLDFLATAKLGIPVRIPTFALFKIGASYRQLQLNDRSSSEDYVSQVSPEIQVGLSIQLTRNAALQLIYQGIYSGDSASPELRVDRTTNDIESIITNIPTQQAGFIGFEIIL